LPCGRLLPRPGRIEVEVLPPVCPLPDADSALELRDRARARLLAVLGEPDLADTDGVSASRAGRHIRSRRRATAARDETGSAGLPRGDARADTWLRRRDAGARRTNVTISQYLVQAVVSRVRGEFADEPFRDPCRVRPRTSGLFPRSGLGPSLHHRHP